MNSIVSSLLNFWIATPREEPCTQTAKLTVLKTNDIGNTSVDSTEQPLQASSSPRNNLQLVSSVNEITTMYDNQAFSVLNRDCGAVPVWRVGKVDGNFVPLSENSMQPKRDITSFVIKNRAEYSKRNFYQDCSGNRNVLCPKQSPSLTVNTFTDDVLVVRCMKSLQLDSFHLGKTPNSSYLISMKNVEDDCSNFQVFSSLPISSMSHACYYELTLVEAGNQNTPTVCIGYGKYDNDLLNHVGWFSESLAFHTDDQRLRNSQRNSMYRVGGPQITKGDTIGVYWDLNNGTVYFTKNGEFIDYKTRCNVMNSNDFLIALSGQVNGNSTLTFKLNVGNERFQCKHLNDLYHLSESQTRLSGMIDSGKLFDIFITTRQ